jgi:hypothetical protein
LVDPPLAAHAVPGRNCLPSPAHSEDGLEHPQHNDSNSSFGGGGSSVGPGGGSSVLSGGGGGPSSASSGQGYGGHGVGSGHGSGHGSAFSLGYSGYSGYSGGSGPGDRDGESRSPSLSSIPSPRPAPRVVSSPTPSPSGAHARHRGGLTSPSATDDNPCASPSPRSRSVRFSLSPRCSVPHALTVTEYSGERPALSRVRGVGRR